MPQPMAGLDDYTGRYGFNDRNDDLLDSRPQGTLYRSVSVDEPFDLCNPPPTRTPPTFSDDDDLIKKYVGNGVALVSLITENLLSHPFVVLRRQCQVHNNSKKFHLVPITLIPVICQLHQHQGLTTLWKGLGSALLVRGMSLGVEDIISKVTPWPKEITWHSSLKSFMQHTFLKCLSLAIITPFYSASLVETVQSDIASEKPGILDVFREGAVRLLNWGSPSKGRMLPIWALVLPTVTLGIARYFFTLMVRGSAARIMHVRYKYKRERTGALPRDLTNTSAVQELEFSASLLSVIAADVAFYPFETILHRLHLQGTRTIVDNLDTGKSVLPILTNYHGPIDCYENCLNGEGVLGLYKGFGALILQYAAHIAVVRITRFVLVEITTLLRKTPKPAINASPPLISNMTTSAQTYLIP